MSGEAGLNLARTFWTSDPPFWVGGAADGPQAPDHQGADVRTQRPPGDSKCSSGVSIDWGHAGMGRCVRLARRTLPSVGEGDRGGRYSDGCRGPSCPICPTGRKAEGCGEGGTSGRGGDEFLIHAAARSSVKTLQSARYPILSAKLHHVPVRSAQDPVGVDRQRWVVIDEKRTRVRSHVLLGLHNVARDNGNAQFQGGEFPSV